MEVTIRVALNVPADRNPSRLPRIVYLDAAETASFLDMLDRRDLLERDR